MKKKEEKLSALERHLRRFDVACDLYPLMRLLLPGVDQARATYGLKESNLAKMYGDMLGLPEAQKQRLLRWKDPALQEGYKCAAGDFASVLYSVVENRPTVSPGQSPLTLGDVNAALDRIHNGGDLTEKRTHMLELVRRASATEQKWAAKIILKDLKIGFSHESVLKRYHPHAMELYNRSSMLNQVLDEIRGQYIRARAANNGTKAEAIDGKVDGVDGKTVESEALPGGFSSTSLFMATGESILFSKFKPMLAQRLHLDDLPGLADGSKSFSLETKYDGERILVHVDCETRRVELYSRNAIDYTGAYAPTMRTVFLDGVLGKQAVLDGEMVAWDEADLTFLPFGNNRTVARQAESGRHLCYVAFDVLFYTDKDGQIWDLRRTPLQGRRELLERIMSPKEHWLEVAPSMVVNNAADVQNRLEGAMEAQLEGLVLKDLSSKYAFNARKRGWFKIKPEYDGLAETLDLLVVGAYFGDSHKRRTGLGQSADLADNVSQFLLAALVEGGGASERVITVGRVGTGFNVEQLKSIRDRLRPHLRRYDPHRPPPWLGGWRGTGKAKPDALVTSPTFGFVMEVRASELVVSDEYELGHTLRFPRAIKPIREDKDWSDACTEQDLRDFLQDGRGQLRVRRHAKLEVRSESADSGAGGGVGATPTKRRKREKLPRGASYGVLDHFRETDLTSVPVASQLLAGAEVFVVNGDLEYSKADLETYVKKHGGRIVQNYIRGQTSLVVAATIGDLRARNLARTAQVDIHKYKYLFDCSDAGRMLPLQPWYLLHICPETQQRFAGAFDKWKDAFYEEVSPTVLLETIDAIPAEDAAAVPGKIIREIARHLRSADPSLQELWRPLHEGTHPGPEP